MSDLQPYRPEGAPRERGHRIATFPRGKDAELRVCLDRYQGRPFVSLRVWERGSDGQLWPARGKGCSVRIGECRELAEVLAALPGEHADDRRHDRDRPASRGTSTWHRPPQRSLPAPQVREFDEFTDG